MTLTAGKTTAAADVGGAVTIKAGEATNGGTGGAMTLTAGAGAATGGAVTITTGLGTRCIFRAPSCRLQRSVRDWWK